ncbi:uncharacterized protein L3040_001712 [Drepanopeziza brunnea f. sp. 'multigermtubi']|uniref:uncharacterized protein n=1 Tax=Drepanopeziza brunnea f. sp. 'multigermtubi' TaxID=698441 RepID=UPI002393B908|nr:hypothetical protein L3040_001712 [Drepanopeziza brunnea f. sp. 'multigermtubi']
MVAIKSLVTLLFISLASAQQKENSHCYCGTDTNTANICANLKLTMNGSKCFVPGGIDGITAFLDNCRSGGQASSASCD